MTESKTWTEADARARRDNGEKEVFGWEGGPQEKAAVRSIAQHMELRKRKGAKLERRKDFLGWGGGPQSVMAIRDRRANVP